MDAITAKKKCEKVRDRQISDPSYREGRYWESKMICKQIDLEELRIGIEVEMEHTNSNILSTKIALDHLAEFPDYYSALKKMEDELQSRHG